MMTIDEAWEYVDRAIEAEGEQRGEYGMGAVSLGYNGAEAMWHYDGYRTSTDPQYAEARKIIAAYQSERQLVKVTLWPKPDTTDDIPF